MNTEENRMPTSQDEIRSLVRQGYGRVATQRQGSCCDSSGDQRAYGEQIGYSTSELDSVPEGANLGLGCGNPTALAELKPGEVVVDLGAGAGFDALIAAPRVGAEGRVIGVDMTPEMLEKARANAVMAGFTRTVEFREGIIEALPVVSESADVVISNCVINLSPDKPQVFRETFRVLKAGGRLAVSNILLSEPLPKDVAELASSYVACLGGAMVEDEYLAAIKAAGFVDVRWTRANASSLFEDAWRTDDPIAKTTFANLGKERVLEIAKTVWSYRVEARKP